MTMHFPRRPIALDPLIAEAQQRMRRRRFLLAGVIALSVLAYLAFTRPDRGPSVSPTAAVQAGTILSKAQAQHSVHYTSWESMGAGGRLLTSADVANGRGVLRQTLLDDTVGGAKPHRSRFTIVAVGVTVYVRGRASGLKWLLGLPREEARRYAGRWISLPRGSGFSYLARGGTLESFLRQIAPHGRLAISTSALKDGQRVIGITGTSPWGQTFLTARSSSLLPVSAGFVAGGQGRTKIGRWNEPVHVRAPVHSIPIATVRRG